MTDEQRRELEFAAKILESDTSDEAARRLARFLCRMYPIGGSLDEQNQRIEAWAKGSDERLSACSDALHAAGIESPTSWPTMSLAERVAILAADRDDWRARARGAGASQSDHDANLREIWKRAFANRARKDGS